MRRFGFGLLWKLHWRFSPLSWPRSWVHFSGSQIAVDRARAAAHDVTVDEVAAVAKAHLEAHPAVARAWTLEEIREGSGEYARLYRHSVDPARIGDLVVQLEPGCLVSRYEGGTTHGMPYDYDRAVPLVFWGSGIAPERVAGRVATVDIAPTLARRLGIPVPRDLDGRVLFE